MKTLFAMLAFFIPYLACLVSAQPGSLITILPGANVEVGQEVYFDAVAYTTDYGDTIQCEWDFGDGYYLRAGAPLSYTFETGLAVVHHFMIPGTFNVKLLVSRFNMLQSPPVRGELLATDSIAVTVTGEAPLAGFELWHAPFHARTGQFLYAVVPEGYDPSQVQLSIEKTGGGYDRELQGHITGDQQRFYLDNTALPEGEYWLTAELKNDDIVVSTLREKFSKPYNGAPAVGINEENAFVLNGTTLFLPIGPFMMNKDQFPLWKRMSNTLHTEGYYAEHDETTWSDYINAGSNSGLFSVGPTRWDGFADSPYSRNSNPDSLVKYVETARDLPGLLGWCWDDEPSLGGRYTRVPAFVVEAWNYRTRQLDPQHPAGQQYYGFDYLPYYNPLSGDHAYSFMRSAGSFGGKKTFTGSFITHDAYPLEYKEHLSLSNDERGIIDLWLEGLDNFSWNMAGLIPLGTFIEPQNVTSFQRMSGTTYLTDWDAGPLPGDIRTQAWGALIHGMKYIGYFQFFAPTPAHHMSVMCELLEAVTDLTPVILSAPTAITVTDDANIRGSRVDHMVRETASAIYIFAARISEPESEWSEVPEPELIEVRFQTGLELPLLYDDFPLYEWKYLLLDAAEGQTDFSFSLPDGAVRPEGFIVSAVRNPVPESYPDFLYDRWTGNAHPTALDMQGNLRYGFDDGEGAIVPLYAWENVTGSINYETGAVQLHFDQGIPAGDGFVQIAYMPANRTSQLLQINDGNFTDTFARNEVKIYRIPKDISGIPEGQRPTNDPAENLLLCYPNPFTGAAHITFRIPEPGYYKLSLFDYMGKEITTLAEGYKTPGIYTVTFRADDFRQPGGLVFCRLQCADRTETAKLVYKK